MPAGKDPRDTAARQAAALLVFDDLISTLMADGSPQVSTVWIDSAEGLVLFNTAESRIKAKNLRRDPRVAISVANAENPYDAIAIRGRVVAMTHEGAVEHIEALAQRYTGEPFQGHQPGDQRVIVKVEPEKVAYRGG